MRKQFGNILHFIIRLSNANACFKRMKPHELVTEFCKFHAEKNKNKYSTFS